MNSDEFGQVLRRERERERARGGGKGQILPLWSWTRHLPLYYSQQNQNLVKNVGSLEYVDYWPWTCWYLCRNATFKHNNSRVLNAIMPFNKDFTRNHAYVTDCIYKSEGLFENWFSKFSKLTIYCHLVMDSLMIHWYIRNLTTNLTHLEPNLDKDSVFQEQKMHPRVFQEPLCENA